MQFFIGYQYKKNIHQSCSTDYQISQKWAGNLSKGIKKTKNDEK